MFAQVYAKANEVIPALSEEKRQEINAALKINGHEHFQMQTVQSTAFAGGKITQEVSLYLFKTLGGSCGVFNKQKLIDRYITMSLIQEIIKSQ